MKSGAIGKVVDHHLVVYFERPLWGRRLVVTERIDTALLLAAGRILAWDMVCRAVEDCRLLCDEEEGRRRG